MWRLLVVVLSCAGTLGARAEHAAPVPVIFDTDIGNDVDDALALAMIHALADRGECELLAVTITKDHPRAAEYVDVINTFYGRGDIPIGVCRSGVTPKASDFLEIAARPEYAYDIDGDSADDAVRVLRTALSEAEDHSVVFVQVGFSTNLAKLLSSPPDDISPLDGSALVSEKARLLSIMAGGFKMKRSESGEMRHVKEYNVVIDLPSSRELAAKWPGEIVWSGYEIGLAATYPYESVENDYRYVKDHPVREAYEIFCVTLGKPRHRRPCWDLTSVLYAVRPDREYFAISPPGTVTVTEDGATLFEQHAEGRHRYLKLSDRQVDRLVPTLVALSSQPPRTLPGQAQE